MWYFKVVCHAPGQLIEVGAAAERYEGDVGLSNDRWNPNVKHEFPVEMLVRGVPDSDDEYELMSDLLEGALLSCADVEDKWEEPSEVGES